MVLGAAPRNIWLTEINYVERIETAAVTPAVTRTSRENTSKRDKPPAKRKPSSYKMRSLTLSGSSSGKGEEATEHIARFIKSLKENEKFFTDFNDIELVSIKKGVVAEQDIMNFTLACKFRPQEI